MKIAKLTDRFLIKLGDISTTIAPLSGRQKIEMTSLIKQDTCGKFFIDKPAQELFLIKHSIKEVTGLKDLDGNDYRLDFAHDGSLSDECAEELLGFLVNTMFTFANTQVLSGLFGDVVNPFNGEKISGVSVERIVKEGDEKK
jgi:hypothetical protein